MKKKTFKQKNGWTLVELCVALIALAILVGLSVQAIKPKKFMIGPFAYAGFYNLRQATVAIMNKCTEEGGSGIYGCQPNTYKLPVTDEAAVNAINSAIQSYNASNPSSSDEEVDLDTIDEIFCMEVGNLFTLANNDTIHCKYKNGNGDGTKLPVGNGKGGNAGVANFQASNMVSYYFLERPWLDINKASPEEQALTQTTVSQFKPIFIDVNGDKEPNRLGEDQFPLRLYIDGTITPGSCSLYTGSSDPTATTVGEAVDNPNPAYPTNLYCPTNTVSVGGVDTPVPRTESWLETNYPFGYNLYRSLIPEGGNNENRETKVIMRDISYQEAACKSGRDNVVPRMTFCGDDGTDKAEKIERQGANRLKALEDCASGNVDAFCIERLARPANPGLFRLPLI